MARVTVTFSAPLESALEKHPDHVNAIGMISIELANLEGSIAHLLGTLLNIDGHTARIVYFTPKANLARLEVVANLIERLPESQNEAKRLLNSIISRAKAVMGKRHEYIHNAWGFSKEHAAVVRTPLPDKTRRESIPVPIKELTDQVAKIRQINMDAMNARPAVEQFLRPDPSPGIVLDIGPPGKPPSPTPPKAPPAKR